ncbi:MAG: hypothetical protein K6A91_00305 [Clostridia bacterium]|nr:hypothetical protein [Clostridia bacterium]
MLPSFRSRKDRLKPYMEKQLKDTLFVELPVDALTDEADLSFMKGVPLPIKKEDLADISGAGISTVKLADNIAVVVGSDTQFRYAAQYIRFLNRLFDAKLIKVFSGKAGEAFKVGNYRLAMAYLRAGMCFRDDDRDAMFAYAGGCRYWYLALEGSEEDTELIKILKSEASEYYEHLTDAYPEFAPGWYYLGYVYLNEGQYLKAQLAWKKYLANADRDDTEQTAPITEIEQRVEELTDPVKIEQGASLLQSGRLEEGLAVLEPYLNTEYSKWWPLHFYLASAYRELGHEKEAVEGFLNVLRLSPSNTDAMDALTALYEALGEPEKAEKYRKKAEIVRGGTGDTPRQ